jgi:hypothetical protein
MILQRFECQCCGRIATIVGIFHGGDGPDDPPGYYYEFDGDTIDGHRVQRWISASAAAIRFRKIDRRITCE